MARPGDPDVPPASGRGRLSRFLPGRRGAAATPRFLEVAERQAILDASLDDIPIVPAPLGRPRPVPPPPTVAPAAAAPTAAAPAPASVTPAVPPSRMPALPDTTIPMPEPVPRPMAGAPDTAPSPAVEAAALALPIEQEPEPTYEAPLQAGATSAAPPFVSTPTTPSMEAAAPVSEPESDQTGPRRRQPGQTAPEELLQVSPSVGVAADDFFDGLVRRVEGDR